MVVVVVVVGNQCFRHLPFYTLFSMVRRMGEFISYRKKIKIKGQGADRQTGRQVDK